MINSAHWSLAVVSGVRVELSGAGVSSLRVSCRTGLSGRSGILCPRQRGESSNTQLVFKKEKNKTYGSKWPTGRLRLRMRTSDS